MGNAANRGPKLLFSAFLVVFLAVSAAWAAPKERTAVADAVVGQVELSRPSSDKWKKVKTGAKITHRDKVRTHEGARLDVRLPDGSTLSIAENSLVDFKELLEEDGNAKSRIRVDKGTVFFSIKKLTTARSEFKFETQTATAAIRGTDGFVQSALLFQYLTERPAVPDTGARESVLRVAAPQQAGALDVKRVGGAGTLGADSLPSEGPQNGAPAPMRPETTVVRDAFYLSNGLMAFDAADGRTTTTIAANQLVSAGTDTVRAFQVPRGADVNDLAAKSAAGTLPGLLEIPLTGAVSVESPAAGSLVEKTFRMSGRCTLPDSAVTALTVGGKKVKVDGGAWTAELSAPAGDGESFEVPVSLKSGNKTTSFTWSLRRARPKAREEGAAFEIWGEQPFVPVDGVIAVAGQARCPVSSVEFRVGSQVSAATLRFAKDGSDSSATESCTTASFSARMAVSDKLRNWNETEGTVVVKSPGSEALTAKVAIAVDKRDPAVNVQAPAVSLNVATDGKLAAVVTGNEGDTVSATLFVDGLERDAAQVAGNGQARFGLQSGVHDYRVLAVDLAGNATERTLSGLEWWPRTNVSLQMEIGSRGSASRVPPLPPNMERNRMETLRLRLLGLPDDDWRAVKRIVVTSGAGVTRELTGTEIGDVHFDVEIPVRANGSTAIKVTVEPKNGLEVEKTIKYVPGK